MTGSWQILDLTPCDLPQKVATGFGEATQGLVGAQYIPVLYCATQVVAGMNHMIICKQTLATNPPAEAVVKMILHEALPVSGELAGKFTIMAIEKIV